MIKLYRIHSFHVHGSLHTAAVFRNLYRLNLTPGTTLTMSLIVDTLAYGHAPLGPEPCIENLIYWQSLHNT